MVELFNLHTNSNSILTGSEASETPTSAELLKEGLAFYTFLIGGKKSFRIIDSAANTSSTMPLPDSLQNEVRVERASSNDIVGKTTDPSYPFVYKAHEDRGRDLYKVTLSPEFLWQAKLVLWDAHIFDFDLYPFRQDIDSIVDAINNTSFDYSRLGMAVYGWAGAGLPAYRRFENARYIIFRGPLHHEYSGHTRDGMLDVWMREMERKGYIKNIVNVERARAGRFPFTSVIRALLNKENRSIVHTRGYITRHLSSIFQHCMYSDSPGQINSLLTDDNQKAFHNVMLSFRKDHMGTTSRIDDLRRAMGMPGIVEDS